MIRDPVTHDEGDDENVLSCNTLQLVYDSNETIHWI